MTNMKAFTYAGIIYAVTQYFMLTPEKFWALLPVLFLFWNLVFLCHSAWVYLTKPDPFKPDDPCRTGEPKP